MEQVTLTPAQAWEHFFAKTGIPAPAGGVPGGLESRSPRRQFQRSTFEALCAHAAIPAYSADNGYAASTRQAAWRLAWLFGADIAAALRFCAEFSPEARKAVHDAGQFSLPPEAFDRKNWAAFASANGKQALPFLSSAAAMEARFGIPRSLAEAKKWHCLLSYNNVENEALAQFCAANFISAAAVRTADQFLTTCKAKAENLLPAPVEIAYNGYTLRLLAPGDFRHLTVGLETGCCQHLTGYAADCVRESYTNPRAGIYVVEKDGELIAQAYAWLATDRAASVVLDSVETKHSSAAVIAAVAQVFLRFAQQLYKQKAELLCSNTGAGISADFSKTVKLSFWMCEPAGNPARYTDAETVRSFLPAVRLAAKKPAKVAAKKRTRAAAKTKKGEQK